MSGSASYTVANHDTAVAIDITEGDKDDSTEQVGALGISVFVYNFVQRLFQDLSLHGDAHRQVS